MLENSEISEYMRVTYNFPCKNFAIITISEKYLVESQWKGVPLEREDYFYFFF